MSHYRSIELEQEQARRGPLLLHGRNQKREKETDPRNGREILRFYSLAAVHPPLQRASQRGHTLLPHLQLQCGPHTTTRAASRWAHRVGWVLFAWTYSISVVLHAPPMPPLGPPLSERIVHLGSLIGAGIRTRGDLPLVWASESADSSCLA